MNIRPLSVPTAGGIVRRIAVSDIAVEHKPRNPKILSWFKLPKDEHGGRYSVLGAGEYVEEHWFSWAGMATISGVGACLGWIRKVS